MAKIGQEELDNLMIEELRITEYPKSNILIGAKYRSSLLENKILAIALSKIKNAVESLEGLVLKIQASELRMMMGKNSGSFYRDLDKVAREMTGRTMGISNPKEKTFDYIAVITRARYEKGELTLVFNHAFKDNLQNLTGNFTKLNLLMMLLFESTFSFRLYELLKSRAFNTGNRYDDNGNTFMIKFGLSELKLSLGIVNAEIDIVKRELRKKGTPDYDRAVEVSPEKQYLSWTKLRTQVLEPAIKEINEKTDITVGYVVKRYGKGGKVNEVIFTVKYNNRVQMNADTLEKLIMESANTKMPHISIEDMLSQEDVMLQIDKVYRLWEIDIPISEAEIISILQAAKYNFYVVYKTYKLMTESSQDIKDPIAYMINGCKKNYIPSEGATKKTREILGIADTSEDDGQLRMEFI